MIDLQATASYFEFIIALAIGITLGLVLGIRAYDWVMRNINGLPKRTPYE